MLAVDGQTADGPRLSLQSSSASSRESPSDSLTSLGASAGFSVLTCTGLSSLGTLATILNNQKRNSRESLLSTHSSTACCKRPMIWPTKGVYAGQQRVTVDGPEVEQSAGLRAGDVARQVVDVDGRQRCVVPRQLEDKSGTQNSDDPVPPVARHQDLITRHFARKPNAGPLSTCS